MGRRGGATRGGATREGAGRGGATTGAGRSGAEGLVGNGDGCDDDEEFEKVEDISFRTLIMNEDCCAGGMVAREG